MVTIEIDEELYAFLTNQAIAFVDKTPNDVLRRLLKINKEPAQTPRRFEPNKRRRKKPKTNLSDLVSAGLLNNGQELFLHDYQGNKINGHRTVLSNGFLLYNGQTYSMSDLARSLLKENGFQSDSVRGPIFWYTENGKSIKELWDIFLKNHYKR